MGRQGGKIGPKVGGFKGETSAQGLRPCGRGYPWASSQRFLVKQAYLHLGR